MRAEGLELRKVEGRWGEVNMGEANIEGGQGVTVGGGEGEAMVEGWGGEAEGGWGEAERGWREAEGGWGEAEGGWGEAEGG